ncbi:hypothetical protein TRFO_01971 [Tritrichomonas foetus]|uniref:Myb-like DNA-binding domain containing protein n=1 Tax=Tritrichomonas foetus TaxID=1144522 RepID=A0A1J4JI57_9EUKA|nr:hypothetical protein TRFO_01971 [Tritrichomonas foetus]|eukprot:OHS96884.1 hypothetical protein TRFO_01971 [Tritrichomonas foetus]
MNIIYPGVSSRTPSILPHTQPKPVCASTVPVNSAASLAQLAQLNQMSQINQMTNLSTVSGLPSNVQNNAILNPPLSASRAPPNPLTNEINSNSLQNQPNVNLHIVNNTANISHMNGSPSISANSNLSANIQQNQHQGNSIQNMPNGKPKKIRKLFSAEEDALLSRIMYEQPFTTWIVVAAQIPGRSARQCRDRWANYLSPENKNGPWSDEEDKLLACKFSEFGPQWTTIAKFFDGRSENNVKNRWYTHLRGKYQSPTVSNNNLSEINNHNNNNNNNLSVNVKKATERPVTLTAPPNAQVLQSNISMPQELDMSAILSNMNAINFLNIGQSINNVNVNISNMPNLNNNVVITHPNVNLSINGINNISPDFNTSINGVPSQPNLALTSIIQNNTPNLTNNITSNITNNLTNIITNGIPSNLNNVINSNITNCVESNLGEIQNTGRVPTLNLTSSLVSQNVTLPPPRKSAHALLPPISTLEMEIGSSRTVVPTASQSARMRCASAQPFTTYRNV